MDLRLTTKHGGGAVVIVVVVVGRAIAWKSIDASLDGTVGVGGCDVLGIWRCRVALLREE